MDLPLSDACFVRAYLEEIAEAFCEGHTADSGEVARSFRPTNRNSGQRFIMRDAPAGSQQVNAKAGR